VKNYVLVADFSFFYHVARSHALEAGAGYDFSESLAYNIEGKLRTVTRALAELDIKGTSLVFAEDRPATRKREQLDTYKNNRIDTSDEKAALKQHFVDKEHDSSFCFADGEEADDVIATVVQGCLDEDTRCLILSGDRDLWQLIDMPRVLVYDPIKKYLINSSHIEHAFRVSKPKHIPLVKSLWGDAGDCVPNVLPRTHKQFLPLIEASDGSYEDFVRLVEKHWSSIDSRRRLMYLDAEEAVAINYELVNLRRNCQLTWG
jgi:5'-3' exonuclease